MKTAMRLV